MTGAEWRTCENPNEMLRALRRSLPRVPCGPGYAVRTPERKMRLFAVAACAGLRWLFRHDWHRLALDATEELADAPDREGDTRRVLRDWHRELGCPAHPANSHLDQAVWSAAFPHEFWEATDALLSRVAWALEAAWGNRTPPGPGRADVVREVFGNPFEPAAFDPAWRTADVVLLARGNLPREGV